MVGHILQRTMLRGLIISFSYCGKMVVTHVLPDISSSYRMAVQIVSHHSFQHFQAVSDVPTSHSDEMIVYILARRMTRLVNLDREFLLTWVVIPDRELIS